MEYLPAELLLKIFKNLNFDELFTIKQTNRYFCEFINKYKENLPRKKFDILYFTYETVGKSLKLELVDFPLSSNLQEKWQFAVDKQIPIYLCLETRETYGFYENSTLNFYPEDYRIKKRDKILSLKLPLYPKNIDELKIVRYWLNQMICCDFVFIEIFEFIINPEIIKLLFDDDEIAKFKINCQCARLRFHSQNIIDWKFTLENFVINELITIQMVLFENTTKDNIILLNLSLNEGDRIPEIIFEYRNKQTTLYNLLINHLETAKDLSKKVASIRFDSIKNFPRSKLNVRGVEIRESINTKSYKITNIHDTKTVFLVEWYFSSNSDLINHIRINRII